MDLTNFWFSSGATGGGGGGGDQGQPIGQSLRFRDSQFLHNTALRFNNGTAGTFSCWFKFANLGAFNYILGGGTSTDNGYLLIRGDGNNLGLFQTRATSGGTFTDYSADRFRDPSAWYHLCLQNTVGGQLTLFVNGEQIGQLTPTFGTASAITIGNNLTTGNDDNLNGYLADVYFIDGQVLEPTAFGRFNDNDIWVPREVDFTPAEMRWSDFLAADMSGGATPNLNVTDQAPINVATDSDVVNAFDGNTTTRAYINNGANNWLVWNPDQSFALGTGLRIFTQGDSVGALWVNNAAVANITGDPQWYTIALPAGTTDITSIALRGTATAAAPLHEIEIDGNPVLNPFIWSADLAGGTENTYQADAADRTGNVTDGPDAFDGGLSSSAFNNVQSDFLYFNPTPPITGINTLFYRTAGTIGETRVNGDVVTITSTGTGTRWVEINNPPDTLEELAFTCSDGFSQLCAVGINGTAEENILIEGVNNSYGANGFHLTFADPDNLGLDSSGNGNDFTATGFDTDPVGIFSEQVFSSNATTIDWNTTSIAGFATSDPGGFGRQQMFDGNAAGAGGSNGQVDSQNWVAVWRPQPPLEVTNLRIAPNSSSAGAQFPVWVNGDNATAIATLTGGNTPPWENVPFTGTLNSIIVGNSTTSVDVSGWQGIEINGNVMVNNTGEDYDLMQDSPTENWATGNPLYFETGSTPGVIDYSKANLAFTSSNNGFYNGWASQLIPASDTNTYYFEFSSTAASGGYPGVVVMQPGTTPWNDQGLSWTTQNGDVFYNTVQQTDWAGATYSANDVAGFSYNASTGVVIGYINGTQAGTFTMDTGIDRVLGCQAPPQNIPSIDFNFGQRPFLYQPADTVPLQTQNLPTPTILNGRDQFRAIVTGPDQGQSYAQGEIDIDDNFVADPAEEVTWRDSSLIDYVGVVTLDAGQVFDPLFVWSAAGNTGLQIFVSEDGNTWTNTGQTAQLTGTHSYFAGPARYIRFGNGGGTWQGDYFQGVGTTNILAFAQTTFPQGLWWVKDMVNANQHQFVDSVTNAAQGGGNWATTCPTIAQVQAYVAPAGDSVAWCWNSAEPATSGFNIVQYTGQNPTTTTVPHGLPGVPDLILTQAKTGTARNYAVYHSALGEGQWLQLNGNDQALSNTTIWNNQAPDATNFYVGAANTTNFSGAVYTAYCWTAIPGYSAFGSYEGNLSDNGPFIYLGFRPAFVLIKNIDNTNGWVIFDTTRNPWNTGNMDALQPNTPDSETPGYNIDLLSNGFKLRDNTGDFNNSQTYVYACFAENPFGGENTAPVTAR